MKSTKWPVLLIVFAAGIGLGATLSPWRFEFISQAPAGVHFLYRVDHLTGAAELSIHGRQFTPIARKLAPTLPVGWVAIDNP